MSYFAAHRRALIDRGRRNFAFTILIDTTRAGSANNTMQLPIRGTNMTIDWGDGFVQTGVTQTADPISTNWITRVYATSGTYQIRITGGLNGIGFNNTGDRLKLLEIRNWGTIVWTAIAGAFHGCSNMVGTFSDVPNLSSVTSLGDTFNNATLFNGNISNWNVSNVISLAGTFRGAISFNQNIGSWDV